MDQNNGEPIKISLVSSTVTNKYYIVTKFIERVAEHCGEDFSNWFIQFLVNCYDEDKKVQTIIDNIPNC